MRDIIITATADVSSLLNAMRAAGRSVGDMAGQVQRNGNAAAGATDTFVGRMLSRINSVGGSVIAGAVGGMTAVATQALGSVVARGFEAAKGAVIDFNSTLQNATIGFTTMLGSGAKSKAFLDQLQSFAKSTPFEFKNLVSNAQNLMGMGVSAKQVIPTLTALGDSVAAMGGSAQQVDSVTLAFGQMTAKGTLDMGNMQQILQNGVPNALKIMAAGYKVSTGEMIKMISTGKVQSEVALPMLVKGIEKGTAATAALGGMMSKQSQTFSGAMSNISDSATQTLAHAFKPLFDGASSGAQALATVLGSKQMTVWSDKINAATAGVMKGFSGFPSMAGLVSGLPGILDSIVKRATPVIKGIGDAFATYGPMVVDDLGKMAGATKPVIGALMNLAPLVPPLAARLGELAATVGGALAGAWSTLAPIVSGAVDVLGKILGPILKMPGSITLIVGALVAWKAATMGMAAVNAVIAGYTAFTYGAAGATYASGAAAKIYAVLTNGVGIATKVAAAGQWLLNAAMDANPIGIVVLAITALVAGLVWFFTQTKVGKDIWSGFVKFLQDAWQAFTGWIGGALKAVIGFFTQWGPTILAVVAPFIGIPMLIIQNWRKILAFFTGLGKTVISALQGAGKWLVETGSKLLDGLLDGAKAGLIAVGRWELGIGKTVIGWLSGAEQWLVSTGVNVLRGLASGAKTGFTTVTEFIGGIQGKVTGALAGARTWLLTIGGQIIGGLVSGIRGGIDDAVSAISGLINLLPEAARKLLGIASPSKVFRQIGAFVGAGLVKGIAGTQDQVKSAMASLSDKVTTAFNTIADQRTAAQKRLKTLDQQLGDVNTATKAGAKRAAMLRGQISDEKSLLGQLTKQSNLKSGLTATISADTAALSKLAAQRDRLTDRLAAAQDKLTSAMSTKSDYAGGVASGIAGQGAVTQAAGGKDADGNDLAVTAGDIIAQKQKVLTATQAFMGQLSKLKAQGLNADDYKALVDQFQSSGDTSIADALAAGGPAAVAEVNGLNDQLNAAAASLGDQTSTTLYQSGVTAAQGVVDGLQSQVTAVTGAMGVVEANLASAVSKLNVNTSALMKDAGGKISRALADGVTVSELEKAVAGVEVSAGLSAKKLATATSKKMRDAGGDIIDGLAAGLKGKSGQLDDIFDDLSKSMVTRLKKALGIKSPSTKFRDEVGLMIPAGVAEGIDRGASVIDASLMGMVDPGKVKDAYAGSWSSSGASGTSGGAAGASVHNEITIAVPPSADRDDVEYAEDMLGKVRFAVGATSGAVT